MLVLIKPLVIIFHHRSWLIKLSSPGAVGHEFDPFKKRAWDPLLLGFYADFADLFAHNNDMKLHNTCTSIVTKSAFADVQF